MSAPLLVELLTEELPPKSLAKLAGAFREALEKDLRQQGFLEDQGAARIYATPRRLAVLLSAVRERSPDVEREVQGPSVKAGLDPQGKPTAALAGFARKAGVAIEQLERRDSPKGEVFYSRSTVAGKTLEAVLAAMVESALKALPAAKLMRWGSGAAEFVRPVHGLVMLHGERVIPGRVLGIESGNVTQGHRFMGRGAIALAGALEYEARLEAEGMVIADFAARRDRIEQRLLAEARRLGAGLSDYHDLLDEVAALVEHPSVYAAAFDAAFLEVPQECLILTMRQNQKYFPLFDADGRLLAQFLIVSNMQLADPRHIVNGNQRVVRPRLEDARFFYNQDRRARLETRVPLLARMVYHNKLGSQLERVERLQLLAGNIARTLDADAAMAERAAWLAKADLVTGMVGEFPELQGVMGRYYALHDGEPAIVADAIAAHYRPRFAGDALPEGRVAAAVALADKLDAIVGIFGIGLAPTGDKDPFALRRHALGVIRILVELELPLDLEWLIGAARDQFSAGQVHERVTEVHEFVLERLRSYLRELGYGPVEIDAVVSQNRRKLNELPKILDSARAYFARPEARDLAEINKRVLNIIRKNRDELGSALDEPVRTALLAERAEIDLHAAIESLTPALEAALAQQRYDAYFDALVTLKPVLERFFDKGTGVLVMHADRDLRANRARMLQRLGRLMNRIADVSRLAA